MIGIYLVCEKTYLIRLVLWTRMTTTTIKKIIRIIFPMVEKALRVLKKIVRFDGTSLVITINYK